MSSVAVRNYVPLIFFAYTEDGSQTITATSPVKVTLGTTAFSDSIYSVSSSVITIGCTGVYEVTGELTFGYNTASSDRQEYRSIIMRDTGGGMTGIAYTRARAYGRSDTFDGDSTSITAILQLDEGDSIQLAADRQNISPLPTDLFIEQARFFIRLMRGGTD